MNTAPQNDRMEAGLLGFLIAHPGSANSLVTNLELRPEDFWSGPRRELWEAVVATVDLGHHPDRETVLARLSGLPDAERWVDDCLTHPAATGDLRAYAAELKRLTLRRAWREAGFAMIEASENGDEALVAQAEQIIAKPTQTEDTTTAEQLGSDVYDWMQDTSRDVAISTGFPAIDRAIGQGLRPGDITAIGGWTNMGKSPLLDGMLFGAAVNGKRVHLYSNEISMTDRTLRLIARMTGLSMTRMQARDLKAQDATVFAQACSRIPFAITDISQWSAGMVARHIRANKWDLCGLDVLHNMAYEGEAELSAMCQTLAAAVRSSESHLIIGCHLNDKRADSATYPRPVMRDIRSSGMIVRLASNVVLLHREQHKEADGEISTSLDGFLHWDKARHGQPCMAPVTFRPKRMGFFPQGHLEAAA